MQFNVNVYGISNVYDQLANIAESIFSYLFFLERMVFGSFLKQHLSTAINEVKTNLGAPKEERNPMFNVSYCKNLRTRYFKVKLANFFFNRI